MSSATASPAVQATRAQTLSILIGASVMLSISMGMRQSLGLFMVPVTRDLSLTVSDYTLALAIQNIVWGVSQPVIGALADRFGCRVPLLLGTVLYALGLVVTIEASGQIGLVLGAGVLIGLALACTAANLAMTASARAVSAASRSMVLGIISAAGSLGTLIAAPMAQTLIVTHGWQFALGAFVAMTAVMLPAAFFTGNADKFVDEGLRLAPGEAPPTFRGVLREASRHRGYVTMSGAFFVCGLQLIFLTTHLPTFLANCGQDPMLSAQALATIGMFNVAGCYVLGWLGGRYPKHTLLGIVYILRSVAIAVYFMMPVSQASTLVFAAIMGMLWLGVAPLVQGMVAQMFGLRYMATLTGIAFFNHQIGSFLGAWGGGLIYDALGSYDRAWQFGVAVGLVAGVAQMMAGDEPKQRVLKPAPA
jgi:predicted MFS family arabinose efflux permease